MNVDLTGVPETMLLTLHDRASEAARSDGVLRDETAVRIYKRIAFPFRERFGAPKAAHGVRAALFDERVRAFLAVNPSATIVSLGEGLETQRYRIASPECLWISVDLPEAIDVREQFISPDARHRHIRCSALDLSWMESVPRDRPVFVVAQGLFMYLSEADVRGLLLEVERELPGSTLLFDVVPAWQSRATRSSRGWSPNRTYKLPPMPWGRNTDKLRGLLREWLPAARALRVVRFPDLPRGPQRWAFRLMQLVPVLRQMGPSVAEVVV